MSTTKYFNAIRENRGQRQVGRIRHQMGFLYENIDFEGKTVLDIGGGIGLHALYASSNGATQVTIVEPEGDGGYDTMISTFKNLRAAMEIENVELVQTTIQNFEIPEAGFDVVLIQDAINHFDEPACVTLQDSEESRKKYDVIFSSIAELVKPGGILIMSDCSSKNLFPTLGMRNPFDPMIEWEKHQPPSVWAEVASPHGLQLVSTRWSSPAKFGEVGKLLFGNALAAWFFTSHFVTVLRRVK